MSGLIPYILFDGTARQALTDYQAIFGGKLFLHDYASAGRTDGPADAIAHGMVIGDVEIAGSDAGDGESSVSMSGMFFSLLGAADPGTLSQWFDALAEGGSITDPLQKRPWGDYDGTVVDKYGITWLIGYQEPQTTQGQGATA